MAKMMKFSPSALAFYDPEFHRDVPADATDVTEAQWVSVMNEVYSGRDLGVLNGQPVAVECAPAAFSVDDRRRAAVVSRSAFCTALHSAGILPEASAISAARGDWPAEFGVATGAMKIDWAAKQNISRTGSVVAELVGSGALTEAQADALFEV